MRVVSHAPFFNPHSLPFPLFHQQALVALSALLASAALKGESMLRPRSATAVTLLVLSLAGLMPTVLDHERS